MKKITDSIKEFISDRKKLFLNIRWTILFGCIFYLIFFQESSKETIFYEFTETDSSLVILKYQANERNKTIDSLNIIRYEIIENSATKPRDSIAPSIIRAVRENR